MMKKWLLVLLAMALMLLGAAQAETIEAYGLTIDTQAQTLDLGKTKVTDFEEFKALLRKLPALTRVDMFNTRMEADVMAALTQEFPQIKFGWTVRAGKYRIRTDATAFSTLRKVDEKPRYSSKAYDVLRYCSDLQALDLGHNKITDISFLEGMPHLKYLILADNDIPDITPIASLKELEYLELFMNDFTDLTPLTELPNLIDLNLCRLKLTDLTPLYEMKQLKRLWISGKNPKFTEEELAALKAALPDCEINTTVASCTSEGWRNHPRFYPVRDTFRSQSFIPWTDAQRAYAGMYPYSDWVAE